MKYKILTASNTSHLEGAVFFVLRRGGTLVGGPFVSTHSDRRGETTLFHQAVMEPEEDE